MVRPDWCERNTGLFLIVPKEAHNQGVMEKKFFKMPTADEFKQMNVQGVFEPGAEYTFVIDHDQRVRFYWNTEYYQKDEVAWKQANGHSALFLRGEYFRKDFGVYWAGTFRAGADGKINYFDNYSGHFQPPDYAKRNVQLILGLPVSLFTSRTKAPSLPESDQGVAGDLSARSSLTSLSSIKSDKSNVKTGDLYGIFDDFHGYGQSRYKHQEYLNDGQHYNQYDTNNDLYIYLFGVISGIVIMVMICIICNVICYVLGMTTYRIKRYALSKPIDGKSYNPDSINDDQLI